MRPLISVLLLVIYAGQVETQSTCFDPLHDPYCPIVISFANGNYRLSGADAPVTFDILATGEPVRMGWTAADADHAFLCIDVNQNGTIDSGAELFGNAVVMSDGRRATNGFEALSSFDDNGDGIMNAADELWPHLLLWRDRNHDAVSQPDELTAVTASGVSAIELEYHWTGRRDVSGNTFRYASKVWIGEAGKPATPRPVYDIFFVAVE